MSWNPQPFWRVNFLIASAYVIVLLCLLVVVLESDINEFAKGIITMILGKYLSHIDNMYNFEFGITRTEKAKDETIKDLAKEVPSNQPALRPGETSTTTTSTSLTEDSTKK